MKALLLLVRGYVVLVAAVGFIFGQFFFSTFTFGETVAGVFGVIAGLLGSIKQNTVRDRLVIFASAAAIAGVGIDSYHYYKYLNMPGNDYAWGIVGPFVAGLALIAVSYSRSQVRNDQA
jgi:hypothetical protein